MVSRVLLWGRSPVEVAPKTVLSQGQQCCMRPSFVRLPVNELKVVWWCVGVLDRDSVLYHWEAKCPGVN